MRYKNRHFSEFTHVRFACRSSCSTMTKPHDLQVTCCCCKEHQKTVDDGEQTPDDARDSAEAETGTAGLKGEQGTQFQQQSKNSRCLQPQIDGGWAWVVMIAGFLMVFMVDGISFTFGLLYPDLLDHFGENRTKTSLVGSVLTGLYCCTGQCQEEAN